MTYLPSPIVWIFFAVYVRTRLSCVSAKIVNVQPTINILKTR